MTYLQHAAAVNYHRERRQGHAVTSVRTTQAPVAPVPATPALPFEGGQDAPKGRGYYFTFERCVFEGNVYKFFIRTPLFGTPVDTALTLQGAWDKVQMFNRPTVTSGVPF